VDNPGADDWLIMLHNSKAKSSGYLMWSNRDLEDPPQSSGHENLPTVLRTQIETATPSGLFGIFRIGSKDEISSRGLHDHTTAT
jgi:hypothetical protein